MTSPVAQRQPVRAALAAFFGTTIEFYDFYTYATTAALVLGDVFFPASDPFVSTLASFATFAVGFIARPLSGAVFGHWGDRLGRKKMLILTMFLMGVATTGIGLLLSLISFRLVSSLDHEAFVSWGWRLPFLASFVLLVAGVAVRLGVNESPEFEQAKRESRRVKPPVTDVLRGYWKPILYAAAATTIGSVGFFTNTFMISYVTSFLKMPKPLILDCLFAVTIIQLASQPVSALLAQRFGDARFLTGAALLSIFTPYPMFVLVNSQQPVLIVAGIALAVVVLSAVYAVIAGFMTRAFPTHLRYSVISIAYQRAPPWPAAPRR